MKWSKARKAAFAAKREAKNNPQPPVQEIHAAEIKLEFNPPTEAELEKLAEDKYSHESLLKRMQKDKENILQELKDVEKTIRFLENNSTFIQRELPALRCF